jgi:hypothetical protein
MKTYRALKSFPHGNSYVTKDAKVNLTDKQATFLVNGGYVEEDTPAPDAPTLADPAPAAASRAVSELRRELNAGPPRKDWARNFEAVRLASEKAAAGVEKARQQVHATDRRRIPRRWRFRGRVRSQHAEGRQGFWRLAVTAIGQAVPEDGILLYNLTLPANSTDATDPNLAKVTLTDVRRIEIDSRWRLAPASPEKWIPSVCFRRRIFQIWNMEGQKTKRANDCSSLTI